MPPVGIGVDKFDGSSDVKMVAVEGDRVYRWARTPSNPSVKPKCQTIVSYGILVNSHSGTDL